MAPVAPDRRCRLERLDARRGGRSGARENTCSLARHAGRRLEARRRVRCRRRADHVDGLTFSDELGGVRLQRGWGSGSLDDLFVLVEEITGDGPAILIVRGMTHRFGNRTARTTRSASRSPSWYATARRRPGRCSIWSCASSSIIRAHSATVCWSRRRATPGGRSFRPLHRSSRDARALRRRAVLRRPGRAGRDRVAQHRGDRHHAALGVLPRAKARQSGCRSATLRPPRAPTARCGVREGRSVGSWPQAPAVGAADRAEKRRWIDSRPLSAGVRSGRSSTLAAAIYLYFMLDR